MENLIKQLCIYLSYFLDIESICNLSRINKHWKNVLDNSIVWERFIENKKYLEERKIEPSKEIVKKEKFEMKLMESVGFKITNKLEILEKDILEFKDANKSTVIQYLLANESYNYRYLRYLLEKKADLNSFNSYNNSAFINAIRNRNCKLEDVDYLVRNGANLHQLDSKGSGPFHRYCDNYNMTVSCEILEYLIEHNCDPNLQNSEKSTPFSLFLKYNQTIKAIELFLKHGADPNLHSSDVPLLRLSNSSQVDFKVLELLIKAKINVNVKGGYNTNTPLHCLVNNSYSKTELIKLFLDNKADPNIKDYQDNTPFHCLSQRKMYDNTELKLFIENKADPNIPNKDSFTPFHNFAIKKFCDFNVIKLFIESKGDPNWKSKNGQTPFHYVCSLNNIDVESIKYLLQNKADPNVKNYVGNTPINWANSNTDLKSRIEKIMKLDKFFEKFSK
uniref:Predicted protein n=1 Tax=Hordeum vulgare subsp. vulgare TaxID=112509 RepID=F2DVS1_HORVV|nr:predicted protein [Hordeum vulgare subsp. vulgare]